MSEEKETPQYELGYPVAKYRHSDAACGYEVKTVYSKNEESKLDNGWFASPSDMGIETCPGQIPCPNLAKKREEFLASLGAVNVAVETSKKSVRPKKQGDST